MAETNTPPNPPRTARQPREKNTKMVAVDIVNNLRCVRVIDRGDEAHQSIAIQPGEIKQHVELAQWVIDELRARNRKKRGSELEIYPDGQAPAPKSDASDEDDGDEDADDAE